MFYYCNVEFSLNKLIQYNEQTGSFDHYNRLYVFIFLFFRKEVMIVGWLQIIQNDDNINKINQFDANGNDGTSSKTSLWCFFSIKSEMFWLAVIYCFFS